MRKNNNQYDSSITLGYIIETNLYNILIKAEETFYFCRNKDWWIIDLATCFLYMTESPYKTLKKLRPNENNFIYGETSIMTICKILKDIDASSEDIFIDLGSGRGLTVFGAYLANLRKAVGIEIIEKFANKSNKIASYLNDKKIKFICCDLLCADLNEGTIIFIAATTMEMHFLRKIAELIKNIPHSVKIVSVSKPLPEKSFKRIFSKKYRFSWGMSTVFFQTKE